MTGIMLFVLMLRYHLVFYLLSSHTIYCLHMDNFTNQHDYNANDSRDNARRSECSKERVKYNRVSKIFKTETSNIFTTFRVEGILHQTRIIRVYGQRSAGVQTAVGWPISAIWKGLAPQIQSRPLKNVPLL